MLSLKAPDGMLRQEPYVALSASSETNSKQPRIYPSIPCISLLLIYCNNVAN